MTEYKSIVLTDIDGCIGESIFPNIEVKADIEAIKKKMKHALFYEHFINFYNLFKDEHFFIFMTGRQKKFFFTETMSQFFSNGLTEIKEKDIYFTPNNIDLVNDDPELRKKNYFGYRLRTITSIILNADNYIDRIPEKIYIFDDIAEYFPDVKKMINVYNHNMNYEIIFKQMKSDDDWKEAYSIKIY